MSFWRKLGGILGKAEHVAAPVASTVFPQFGALIGLVDKAVVAAESAGGHAAVKHFDATNHIEKGLPSFLRTFGVGLGLAGDPDFREGIKLLLEAMVKLHNAFGHFDHDGKPAPNPIKH